MFKKMLLGLTIIGLLVFVSPPQSLTPYVIFSDTCGLVVEITRYGIIQSIDTATIVWGFENGNYWFTKRDRTTVPFRDSQVKILDTLKCN